MADPKKKRPEDEKIDLVQEMKDIFTMPSAYANAPGAAEIARIDAERRKKKRAGY